MSQAESRIDAMDRRLILATQAGLPLTSRPFATVGVQLGIEESEVIERFKRLKAAGVVRRIAAVPNHYAIGYRANAMTVWDVPEDRIDEVGRRVGALDFVSHCYRRPRHLPVWRYNLFAMVHGADNDEVNTKVAQIENLLGDDCRAHETLLSSAILKKTGLRLAA